MSGRVVFAPILHGSLPFALRVREAFSRERPDCVAVELPETLSVPVERALRRLPLLSVLRFGEPEGTPRYLLVEPCDGVFEALRLAREHGLPWHLVDRDTESYPDHDEALPDPYAMDRIGYDAYVTPVAQAYAARPRTREDELREATMAFHLAELARRYEKVLFVCGIAHVVGIERHLSAPGPRPLGRTRRPGVEVFHLSEESSREVLSEPGYVQALFERVRSGGASSADATDRYAITRALLLEARARLKREDGDDVPLSALAVAVTFARNQALVRAGLAPDLFELTVAARGVASDDYAWHVWDLGVTYPHQSEAPDLAALRVTPEDLQRGSHRVWFRRKVKTRRHVMRLVRGRPLNPERTWNAPRSELSLCSYPPEDLRIEAYGAELRRRGQALLDAERARVSPFFAGLAEGIDLRETIRNWAHDGRIYVREERRASGSVGALCIVFDAEDRDERYGWTMTWQGEHEEESDMALYATRPEEHLVGPGIGRSEYGGLLMTYPPGRMFNVFEDPYFDHAETRAERLLLAAVDYCSDRNVLYVAARPPRPKIAHWARRCGKKLIYLPIGQISADKRRRLRVFHVLEGHRARSYAGSYIDSPKT